MKRIAVIFLFFICLSGKAQNMVPDPSFEDTLGCFPGFPHLDCLNTWNNYSGTGNPVMNTADLCYNTAVFFPPSSIPAYDGTKYIGLDCQTINPEYVQVRLSSAMTAGTSYCVSFYASLCDQTDHIAPSLGAVFSVNALTVNPHTAGMSAHVQGVVPADPAIWTKISGTYIASGGEEFITLGGFQNNTVATSYMYIDMVEVIACNEPPPPPPMPEDTLTESTLYIPNSFSPNGDGLNDLFGALGENIDHFELAVFDRWGERIFYSASINDLWDGTCHGHCAAQDVYVYTLNYENGTRMNYRTGHVVLLR